MSIIYQCIHNAKITKLTFPKEINLWYTADGIDTYGKSKAIFTARVQQRAESMCRFQHVSEHRSVF